LRCALFAEQHAAALDRDGDRTRGGGYNEIGKQYQELLARNGVELRLVATLGSVENLALLRDPKSGVDIALVQGGSIGKEAGELESLGTLFYEPLWIFHRGGLEGATLAALDGLTGWTSARPPHPDHRGAVPNVSGYACFVWLVDASEDRATVRRAKISGGRDHRRRTKRSRSADGASRSAREAGKPAQDADRL
jgi:hypothetical protein